MKNESNKKYLTIFGIFLVLIGIPLTIFLLKDKAIFKSIASDTLVPKNINITNISDNSFTITYQTDTPTTGSLSYGHNQDLGESELDDVDKEKGSFSSKKTHSISVRNLTPDTKYYLAITSGSSTFLNDDTPFEVTTGPEIASPSAQENTVKGKILLPNGSPPSEVIIYLSADDSQLLSTTATKDGTFIFLIRGLRTKSLSEYFNIQDGTIFKINATDGSLQSSASATLSRINTLPSITLSSNYNFTQEIPSSKSATLSRGFPSITPPTENTEPEILTPKENQSFNNPKPKFSGKSLPNGTVSIVIHSEEVMTAEVTADSNGNWIYNPPSNLSPGTHIITIKTRDSSGILKTVEQSFTVYAADSQISGSITPTVTPYAQTTTPTLAPTSNSVFIIPVSTSSPTPILTTEPATLKGGLPATGSFSAYLGTIIGIAATFISFCIFIFVH